VILDSSTVKSSTTSARYRDRQHGGADSRNVKVTVDEESHQLVDPLEGDLHPPVGASEPGSPQAGVVRNDPGPRHAGHIASRDLMRSELRGAGWSRQGRTTRRSCHPHQGHATRRTSPWEGPVTAWRLSSLQYLHRQVHRRSWGVSSKLSCCDSSSGFYPKSNPYPSATIGPEVANTTAASILRGLSPNLGNCISAKNAGANAGPAIESLEIRRSARAAHGAVFPLA
jgi:hypothetical protein